MALKMTRLFGGEPPRAAENMDFEPPTTQVRMGITSSEGYDPLTTMSVMEQLRAASTAAPTPSKTLLIGNLPVVKQFQVLGVLTVMFLILAAFMVYLDNRASSQQSMQELMMFLRLEVHAEARQLTGSSRLIREGL